MPGNYIITDSWKGYSFLDEPEEGYIHYSFNHSLGNFGSGLLSTSRIESVWGELKAILKKIYSTIRSNNFIYFLKESEYRRSIKNLDRIGKLENFSTVISCVGIRDEEDYLNENELKSIEYITYFDD